MKASHIRKLIRPINSAYSEMFSGRVYRVGEGAVSVRNHSGEAEHTVIGVHGFLENHCYFTQTYDAPTTELILLTCSNYHIPVNGVTPENPEWEVPIKHLEGTIEYDACILNQALSNLPSTRNVRIHGHSRGGAVTLEAIKQRPELYEHVEVVLEAPALPQGKVSPLISALLEPVSHGMWPWLIRLISNAPASAYGQSFFGKMNPRKKQLLASLFYSTRDQLTIVRNIENILDWMQRTDTNVYQHVRHGTFLVPGIDRILDRQAMLTSARQSPTTMRIIETHAPSHFVTLDSKEWLPGFESLAAASQG
ncbi:alpha/beta fold hydrolase [Marinobacter salexigens]|uniref:alpha/beta fold hydrolase n=1 Tax=Marinobacter salexigens TaxID=1925763 RepID=UPI000C2887D7|nr:alpha/beta hydrolase [Marinobacter salexigens]